MLIIERGPGERIFIGDEIELCVLDTDGATVRLGISAPRDIAIETADALGSAHTDAGVDTRKMPADGSDRD